MQKTTTSKLHKVIISTKHSDIVTSQVPVNKMLKYKGDNV